VHKVYLEEDSEAEYRWCIDPSRIYKINGWEYAMSVLRVDFSGAKQLSGNFEE